MPQCFRTSCDEAFSVSLQHREAMSQACVAELTSLSSCQSYKGTSVDSSHCHLGTTEMLSLHRSDNFPPKLLSHLAEGGRADSVGPFLLRLSGAGFAHCVPGPETLVWPGAQTLYLNDGLKLMPSPAVVCFSRIKKNIHHVHFLGFTWMDNPLDFSLFRLILIWVYLVGFSSFPVFVSLKYKKKSYLITLQNKTRTTVCEELCHPLQIYIV